MKKIAIVALLTWTGGIASAATLGYTLRRPTPDNVEPVASEVPESLGTIATAGLTVATRAPSTPSLEPVLTLRNTRPPPPPRHTKPVSTKISTGMRCTGWRPLNAGPIDHSVRYCQ